MAIFNKYFSPAIASLLLLGIGYFAGRLLGNLVAGTQNTRCLGLLQDNEPSEHRALVHEHGLSYLGFVDDEQKESTDAERHHIWDRCGMLDSGADHGQDRPYDQPIKGDSGSVVHVFHFGDFGNESNSARSAR